MNTETLTPDEQARAQHRLEFARAWMARKRQEQQEMIEEAKTNPEIIAAFAELDRRAAERGTRIIEL
ncbi:hypothetical protein EXU85_27870 [Spirosoma sp. KCTC 42546]|jgi:hypothetical protein|uniref:hypothetical protein n=1 Tax=Spirosoma sp. KCTC 42546 TaxID=2520506 RepID=UPI00115AB0FB|nr:hypothetical protein [Spirosoma sp. KCTC 42546]QDK82222.1 hypothetical protein EXU85_27870 [Spirosoma sp. KCTC 42546]